MKNNCQICGKEYDCCPDCLKRGNWRSIVCSPDHYQIVQILREYREGILSAKECVERFEFIGINSDSELNYIDAVNNKIKRIIAEGTPKRTSKNKNNKSDETADK